MKLTLATVVTLALAASCAPRAAASPITTDVPVVQADTVALSDPPKIESLPVPGTSLERVRATILIDAPIDRVRTVVFDYDRYPEFMPMYKKASVIWTTPSGLRLVHMELGGLVHLWMRVEISPARREGAVELYEGRLVQGNVKAFRPRWELEAMGKQTRLTVESFMDPDLTLVPNGLVNSGTRDGMRDATIALKARIEGKPVAR